MENSIDTYKIEVEKINQRIKEYLWKAKYLSKTWKFKQKNIWSKFLE